MTHLYGGEAALTGSNTLQDAVTMGADMLLPGAGKLARVGGALLFDAISEGAEEAMQEIGKAWSLEDPVDWKATGHAAGIGALSGMLMGGVGTGINALSGRSKQKAEQKAAQKDAQRIQKQDALHNKMQDMKVGDEHAAIMEELREDLTDAEREELGGISVKARGGVEGETVTPEEMRRANEIADRGYQRKELKSQKAQVEALADAVEQEGDAQFAAILRESAAAIDEQMAEVERKAQEATHGPVQDAKQDGQDVTREGGEGAPSSSEIPNSSTQSPPATSPTRGEGKDAPKSGIDKEIEDLERRIRMAENAAMPGGSPRDTTADRKRLEELKRQRAAQKAQEQTPQTPQTPQTQDASQQKTRNQKRIEAIDKKIAKLEALLENRRMGPIPTIEREINDLKRQREALQREAQTQEAQTQSAPAYDKERTDQLRAPMSEADAPQRETQPVAQVADDERSIVDRGAYVESERDAIHNDLDRRIQAGEAIPADDPDAQRYRELIDEHGELTEKLKALQEQRAKIEQKRDAAIEAGDEAEAQRAERYLAHMDERERQIRGEGQAPEGAPPTEGHDAPKETISAHQIQRESIEQKMDEALKRGDEAEAQRAERHLAHMGKRETIRDVIDEVKTEDGGKSPEKIWVDLDQVTPEEAQKLSAATGLDITERYRHSVSGEGIVHTLKRHGEGNEKHEAQLPVTEEDIEMIPEIIKSYDNVTRGTEKTSRGQDTIVYTKRVNGHVLIVEEVRDGRGKLMFHSMRKSKPGYEYDTGTQGHPVVKEKAGSQGVTSNNATRPGAGAPYAPSNRAAASPSTSKTSPTPSGLVGAMPPSGGSIPQQDTKTQETGAQETPPAQEEAKAEGKPSNTARVRTASGTEIDTRYRVVSAGTLIASHGENGGPNDAYPKELQPRDRSREASIQQIHQMAASLDPELLGENRLASDGAPIVGPDSVVESGNGRVMAIRRAYRTGKADGYRTWLMENAERFGIDPADVEAVADPVLIRERTSDVDRVRFVQEANQSSVSRMSKTEQALADAQRITPEMLVDLDPDADIASAANRKFVQQFLEKVVGDTEKGAFIDARGDLSQEGKERISNALFAYAYGDTEAMARLRETLDDDTKTINTALLGISPRIADMESKMRQGGLRKDLSIREPLMEAINMMAQLKRNGERVSDYLDQGMIFSAGNISPEARAILQFLEENKRSAKKISEGLARYADLVDEQGSPGQGRIFKVEPIPREELIKIAFGHEVGERHATAEERSQDAPTGAKVLSWLDAKKMYRDMFMKGGMGAKEAEAAGAIAATFAQWRAEVTGQSIDDAVKAIGLDVEKATSVPSTGDEHHQLIGRRGVISALTAATFSKDPAMSKMSKRLNKIYKALCNAQSMSEAGASEAAIWQATGWYLAPDGKWRYEIPDGKLVNKPNGGDNNGELAYLTDHYDAPELYKIYPSLKTVGIRWSPLGKGYKRGAYYGANRIITLNSQLSKKDTLEVLIHEIQHAIQRIEGFQRGGSSQAMYLMEKDAIDKAKDLERRKKEATDPEEIRAIDQELAEIKAQWSAKYGDIPISQDALYARLGGEVEANAVEYRHAYWSKKERKARPPSASMLTRDWILLKDDDGIYAMESREAAEAQTRTAAFKKFFGDWEAAAETKTMQDRVASWISPKNIERARGKTREEIFSEFGNELQPIAYIPEGYLRFFDASMTDNRVYSGLGYFLDHIVNHHPGVASSQYLKIQEIIDTADDVKLDAGNTSRNSSILFIKNVASQGVVIVSFSEGENGKIVLYKTFFDKMKAGRFDKMPSIKLPPEVGNPSISPGAKAPAAGRLSALDGRARIPNPLRSVNHDAVSKVVDANGKPLVVYHSGTFGARHGETVANGPMHFGTREAAMQRIGAKAIDDAIQSIETWEEDDGTWSASVEGDVVAEGLSSEEEAYAEAVSIAQSMEMDDLYDEADDPEAVFLNIRNPKRVRDAGGEWGPVIEAAKAEGHDGIVYRNEFEDRGSDSFIAFYPEQIKSATGNRGTFDAGDPDIYHQLLGEQGTGDAARGYTRFEPEITGEAGDIIQAARTVIGLLEDADASTLPHELGHVFLDQIRKLAQMEGVSPEVVQNWETLRDWLHVRDMDFSKPLSEKDKARWRDAHEKMAAGFEKYTMTGKAPNSRLKKAFEAFREWLTKIYESVKNIVWHDADGKAHKFDLPKDVQDVFDRIMTPPSWREGGQSISDITKEAGERIEASLPPKPDARRLGVVAPGFDIDPATDPDVQAADPAPRFTDEETEERYKAASGGISPDARRPGLVAAVKDFMFGFKGDFPLLAGKKDLIPARETLRRLGRERGVAVQNAMTTLQDATKGLSPADFDLFGRKRLLDDLKWRKEHLPDAELPFGFTKDSLAAEHERITKLVDGNERVKAAIEAEEKTIKQINARMVELASKLGWKEIRDRFKNPHYFRHQVLDYAKMLDRGYLERYKGSKRDINADYIQANGDVRATQMQDIRMMQALVREGSGAV